jgi:DNA-binding transcriptional LysR family regulator
MRDTEFLSDPNVGELRIGSSEAISGATLPTIIHQFLQKYDRVTLKVDDIALAPFSFAPKLRERSLDLVLYQAGRTLAGGGLVDDFNVEILFYDQLVVAVGNESPWACRREIDLAELIDEHWILAPPDSWNYRIVAEAFRARGIEMPRIRLTTLSVALRAKLIATGHYIAAISNLVVHSYADRFSMKILPLELPCRPWPVAIITLKNRTLSPVAERFIECARNVARSPPTFPS